MARASMTALIQRIRVLINDNGTSPVFANDDIQNVCDESRVDMVNVPLKPTITYGSTLQYLHYYSDYGGWEDDYVIKQALFTTVTPSSSEPIAGKFTFASSQYPPLSITGKLHDVYHAAADLLERQAAKWTLSYDMTVNGQSLHRSQASNALLSLAKRYRAQQRPGAIKVGRGDLSSGNYRVTDPTLADRTGLGGG